MPILVTGCALTFLFVWLVQYHPLWWIASFFTVFATAAFLSFFRDPWRKIPPDLPDGTMLSPADGVISAIEFVDHHESTETKSVIIRIFLSVLNVHINRSPCDCIVENMVYRKGKFLDARSTESAKVNESNLITFRVGKDIIGVRQVSGKLARHIVCPLDAGDFLTQGQQFGMIKYGSTTELILPRPDGVTLLVSKGDRVYAGLTSVAMLSSD